MVAALNLEPYNAFGMIDPAPGRLESLLREAAMFDHVFALRQWPAEKTADFLVTFFASDHEADMRNGLGWTVADVADLLAATKLFTL